MVKCLCYLGVLATKWLDCLFLSRAQTVTSDQEKRLLHQLREITRVMKEGKFIDTSPEKEAEEAPYMEDWEGKMPPCFLISCHPERRACQFS